nr:dichloromethane dehalogenase-like [Pocillopora verrucosa]
MATRPTLFMKRNSVSCRIVWLYLKQNEIPFVMIDLDECKPSDFESRSPLGTVPVLQDGGHNIYGSQAIVYYLAEKYTNYAGFGKNNERPLIESVINWAATTLLRDIGNNYVYPSLNWPGVALAKESNSSLVDFGKNEVIFHLDVLEKHYLCHHEFLCGNSSTIADCWVAVVLSLLELVCFDLTPWPRLRSWVCSMKSNGDYVDVSYNHEEMVRKSFYNLNSSASDLKTVSVENLT